MYIHNFRRNILMLVNLFMLLGTLLIIARTDMKTDRIATAVNLTLSLSLIVWSIPGYLKDEKEIRFVCSRMDEESLWEKIYTEMTIPVFALMVSVAVIFKRGIELSYYLPEALLVLLVAVVRILYWIFRRR